jgi:hypothetical protein
MPRSCEAVAKSRTFRGDVLVPGVVPDRAQHLPGDAGDVDLAQRGAERLHEPAGVAVGAL